MVSTFVPVVALLLMVAVVSSADQLSEEECTKLGFNKAELYCGRCSELSKFELDELKAPCLQCCREDDKNAKKVEPFFLQIICLQFVFPFFLSCRSLPLLVWSTVSATLPTFRK